MPPRMIVIAGPPGGGKSAIFPISTFGIDAFNADDQAAELNAGSYRNISMEIRARVNRDMEVFVATHIGSKTSFAIETTLRTGITFLQAKAAQAAGFQVDMLYIALRDFAAHVKRVKARAFAGGHSAPADRLREIHRRVWQTWPKRSKLLIPFRCSTTRDLASSRFSCWRPLAAKFAIEQSAFPIG